jgi:hypothetical protein
MMCVISFRWHQSVLFVASILVNEYVAEETAGSDTWLLVHINHVNIMMMMIVMLAVTLNLRNTVDNMNHVLQLELI